MLCPPSQLVGHYNAAEASGGGMQQFQQKCVHNWHFACTNIRLHPSRLKGRMAQFRCRHRLIMGLSVQCPERQQHGARGYRYEHCQ